MLNTHRFYIENYIIVRQVYLELNNFLAKFDNYFISRATQILFVLAPCIIESI